MITNKKTSKTVKANKMTGKAVKSSKKTGQTLKLKPEAKRSTKKQSLKVNKVAKTPTDKTDKLKPSATHPIRNPLQEKTIPIREATQSSLQATPHLQPHA